MNCMKNNQDVEPEGDLELQRVNSERKTWRSCCLTLDRDFVQYVVKYTILIGLIIFFSLELHLSDNCEDKQLYNSLLMFVVGIAIPSPRLTK